MYEFGNFNFVTATSISVAFGDTLSKFGENSNVFGQFSATFGQVFDILVQAFNVSGTWA